MNFDGLQTLIVVCAVKGFGTIITGKKGHRVRATKPFSLCVNASANQSVLCPPQVHGGGVNQRECLLSWEGGRADTLGMRDKVLFAIRVLCFYI